MFKSVNPANGQEIKSYEEISESRCSELLQSSESAFTKWRLRSFEYRSEVVHKIADVLDHKKSELAGLMSLEMGKPVRQAEAEIEKCSLVCRYYADQAAGMLKDTPVDTDAASSYIHYEPLGPVLAVMPWNFPFWQVFRCLAPTLMAGNTMILKHASNVSGCAVAIETVCQEANLDEGVFYTALISVPKIKDFISSREIKAVTLTGSTRAGQSVGEAAGKAIKKVVLELGGSDAYVVLEDADIKKAAEICATSRMINSGQSCVAAKRFVVVEQVYEEFLSELKQQMEKQVMGDPLDPGTDVGPLARLDLRDELHNQVTKSVDQGAKVILGGAVPEMKGAYYPPTILSEVREGMTAYKEELFGPVASVIRASDEDDAVRIANDSVFGLGAAVFTRNLERGERIAAYKLEAGCCFVNSFVRSDPRLPFGGIKESGYGRELGSYGIKEFTNAKTVYVAG